MSNGGVRCWGDNTYGQLGNSSDNTCSRADSTRAKEQSEFLTIVTTTGPCTVSPPPSDTLTGVQAIAVGGRHTCALMDTGGVRCWGDNTYGQLGDGRGMAPTSDVLAGVKAMGIGPAVFAVGETTLMVSWATAPQIASRRRRSATCSRMCVPSRSAVVTHACS